MSATRLAILKTEESTDPLIRGYVGMTNKEVAVDMNIVNRPGESTVSQLRKYFLLERKGGAFLYGRLHVVAGSAVNDDPLGETTPLTFVHITSALTMCNILNEAQGEFGLDLADSRFDALLNDLAAGQGCKVIAPTDKTAIQAFSVNVISRGQELRIGTVSEGDVEHVRNN